MNLKAFFVELFDDEELKDYKPKHPRFWHILKVFICSCIATTIMMLVYIEIGHDKGWPRAEQWYTRLYANYNAPWQNNTNE